MNLVLSGGGVKGLCYISLMRILEEKNIKKDIKNYAGSSIGVFFCFLLCLDYDYNKIRNILLGSNILEKVYKIDILNFFNTNSFCSPKTFREMLELLLYNKLKTKKISLVDLYYITNKTLNIVATNISNGTETIFNKDKTPNYDVIDCIIASCSIPGLYPPFELDNNHYIDGFLVNNYPIDIFKDNLENTIGISLTRGKYYKNLSLNNYIYNLFTILTINKERENKDLYNKLKKNIFIENNIFVLELNIDNSKKIKELEKSYNILKELL